MDDIKRQVVKRKSQSSKCPDQFEINNKFSTRSRKRILVVDDEEGMREILSRMISFMGYEVVLSGSGDEALGLFLKKAFDLVITDLNMPGMDGWALLQSIKNKSPKTPVILITGEVREGVMRKIEVAHVDSVMFKPFCSAEIQRAIRKILNKTPFGNDTAVNNFA